MDSKPINRSSSPTHLPREQNRNATQTTATTRDSRSVDASPAGATNYVSRSGIDSSSALPSYSEYMAYQSADFIKNFNKVHKCDI
jgi:hypothetical protein